MRRRQSAQDSSGENLCSRTWVGGNTSLKQLFCPTSYICTAKSCPTPPETLTASLTYLVRPSNTAINVELSAPGICVRGNEEKEFEMECFAPSICTSGWTSGLLPFTPRARVVAASWDLWWDRAPTRM